MALWFYLGGFSLIIIGFLILLEGNNEKSKREDKVQTLSNKSERLQSIADNLSNDWKV